MQPSISRRRVIGGTAALLTGAAVGAVAAPAEYYPAWVVDRLIGRRSKPEFDWRPPIGRDPIEDGYDALVERTERAKNLWDEIDADREDLPPATRLGPIRLGEAESTVEKFDADEASWDAWYELYLASAAAGDAVGAALVELGEADPEGLVGDGEELRDRIEGVADEVPYRIEHSGEDLGWLYRIEQRLSLARLNSYRGGTYMGGVTPPEEYSDNDIVRTHEAHAKAAESIRLARHWRRAYAEDDGDRRDVEDELETLEAAYIDEVDRLDIPLEEQRKTLDELDEGPYMEARAHLVHATLRNLHPVTYGPSEGLLVYRTIRQARNVLRVRAYRSAREAFELDPDEPVEAVTVYRAEERATEQLRNARDRLDEPLAWAVLREAAGRIRTAHRTLVDEERDRELTRAQSYAAYLGGEHQLEHVSAVLAPFEDGGVDPGAFE